MPIFLYDVVYYHVDVQYLTHIFCSIWMNETNHYTHYLKKERMGGKVKDLDVPLIKAFLNLLCLDHHPLSGKLVSKDTCLTSYLISWPIQMKKTLTSPNMLHPLREVRPKKNMSATNRTNPKRRKDMIIYHRMYS